MAHVGGGFEAPPLTQNHHFSPQNGPLGFIYPGMGRHRIGWEEGVVAGDWLEGKLGGSRGLAGSRARWQQGIGQEHSWQSAIGRGLSPMGGPGQDAPPGVPQWGRGLPAGRGHWRWAANLERDAAPLGSPLWGTPKKKN